MKNVFKVGDKVVALKTTNNLYTWTKESFKYIGVVTELSERTSKMFLNTISAIHTIENDMKADNDDYYFKLYTPPTPEEVFWSNVLS